MNPVPSQAEASPEEPVRLAAPRVPDPSDLLDRVLANHKLFPVRESEKYNVHLASCRLLAEYERIAQPSDELTYAVIRMLRYLKRQREAMELMQRRRPHIPDKSREIDFYEVELHYHGGDRAAGDRLLEKFLSASPKLRPSWKKSLEKIQRRYRLADAWSDLARLESGLSDLVQEVELDAHLALLRNILASGNEAVQVILFIRDRLAALRAMAAPRERVDLGVFAKYHKARLICASGFGWSGSGAAAAFLSQHASVSTPFGMSELGYIQGRSGRDGLQPFLQDGPMEVEAMRRRLARFCLESVVCLSAIEHHYSILMRCIRAPSGGAVALGGLVDDFNAAMLTQEALRDVATRKRVLGVFLQRMFSIQGGTNVLLNNVLFAARLDLLDSLEDARFVVVQRDARDQFVARRLESRDSGGRDLDEFASVIKTNRAGFVRIRDRIAPSTLDERMLMVRFEDFVQQEETRVRVLDWLGLPPGGIVPDLEKFDVNVSARNVGIHREQLSADQCAFVEEKIGVYLQ